MNKNTILITAILTAILMSACNQNVQAESAKQVKITNTEQKIRFRQSAMMYMRWNLGKIKKQVVKQTVPYDKQQIINAANAIAGVANSNLDKLFTPDTVTGTGWKPTLAKATLFKEPENFKARLNAFITEADKMKRIAQSGDQKAIKMQFKSLLTACQTCHQSYRGK